MFIAEVVGARFSGQALAVDRNIENDLRRPRHAACQARRQRDDLRIEPLQRRKKSDDFLGLAGI